MAKLFGKADISLIIVVDIRIIDLSSFVRSKVFSRLLILSGICYFIFAHGEKSCF